MQSLILGYSETQISYTNCSNLSSHITAECHSQTETHTHTHTYTHTHTHTHTLCQTRQVVPKSTGHSILITEFYLELQSKHIFNYLWQGYTW